MLPSRTIVLLIPRDYIHRVGRTARAGSTGRSLLFLMKSELGFLRYLKAAKVPLNEYQCPPLKVSNVQLQLENLIAKNHYLNTTAKDGFRSYLQAYQSHNLKSVFDINKLDLQAVAKAFGFKTPPKVSISAKRVQEDSDDEAALPRRGGGGHQNRKRRRV